MFGHRRKIILATAAALALLSASASAAPLVLRVATDGGSDPISGILGVVWDVLRMVRGT
jgi:hypothetical protein